MSTTTSVLGQDKESGAYMWVVVDGMDKRGDRDEMKRYTAYVKYVYGDDKEDYSIEEIDINAYSSDEARRIAQAALDRDYEPNGKITEIREQWGWYM